MCVRGKPGYREAELFERVREQRVLLEAVAAAFAGDQLRLQACNVEPDRNTEQNVEIFEWNRRRVRTMQRIEHCTRRRQIARVTDPAQIRRQVESALASPEVRHRSPLRQCRPNARTRERDHAKTDPGCVVDGIGERRRNRRGRCLAAAEWRGGGGEGGREKGFRLAG